MTSAWCHSTKSLCDIGGCGLVLSAVPRKEIVDSGAPRMIGHSDPQLHTEKFQRDDIITRVSDDEMRYMREHDNYLDEESETVSARRAETVKAL